jgi:hypothetical protein
MTRSVADTVSGSDAKGATEDKFERIQEIDGAEVLGYDGEAHEEHTGGKSAPDEERPERDMADNRPSQISSEVNED